MTGNRGFGGCGVGDLIKCHLIAFRCIHLVREISASFLGLVKHSVSSDVLKKKKKKEEEEKEGVRFSGSCISLSGLKVRTLRLHISVLINIICP